MDRIVVIISGETLREAARELLQNEFALIIADSMDEGARIMDERRSEISAALLEISLARQYSITALGRMRGSTLFEKIPLIGVSLSTYSPADREYHLDEGVRIAQAIEDYVDLIHVSAGTYQKTFGITHPSWFEEHGRNVYLAAEIKKHVSKPVATVGGLSDPAMMEEIIASGKADVVEMARQLLADNQLPNKVMENRADEGGVTCSTADGATLRIDGDSILCGLGLKPNTAVVDELRGCAPKFFAIGNCVKPDTITYAVYQGYHAALDV